MCEFKAYNGRGTIRIMQENPKCDYARIVRFNLDSVRVIKKEAHEHEYHICCDNTGSNMYLYVLYTKVAIHRHHAPIKKPNLKAAILYNPNNHEILLTEYHGT